MFIRRSALGSHIYKTKTEQSGKPVPLDPSLAEVLLRHKENSKYKSPTDFVVAGDSGRPRWRGILLCRPHQTCGRKRRDWQDQAAHGHALALNPATQFGSRFSRAEKASSPCRHQDDDEHLHSGHGSSQAKSHSILTQERLEA